MTKSLELRFNMVKERISEPERRSVGINQSEEHRRKKMEEKSEELQRPVGYYHKFQQTFKRSPGRR